MTVHFCADHPFFALYLSGVAAYIVLNTAGIVRRYLNRDSILNQNLRLIGLEISIAEGLIAPTSEGKDTFLDGLPHVCSLLLTYNIGALLSWIIVLIQMAELAIKGYKHLTTPAAVRELIWRTKHVQYFRGEDFLELRQKIYGVEPPDCAKQNLEDIQKRAEYLTYYYAKRVLADADKREILSKGSSEAARYLKLAKKLSEETYKTKIIHPAFWKIPKTKAAAEEAVKAKFT